MQIIPRTINNVIVKEGYLKYYLPDHFKNDKWKMVLYSFYVNIYLIGCITVKPIYELTYKPIYNPIHVVIGLPILFSILRCYYNYIL